MFACVDGAASAAGGESGIGVSNPISFHRIGERDHSQQLPDVGAADHGQELDMLLAHTLEDLANCIVDMHKRVTSVRWQGIADSWGGIKPHFL
jgi:hypothetical protein